MNTKIAIYEHRFTVRPSGARRFPVDMLRHDSCFPATEVDAVEIESMLRHRGHTMRMHSVNLVRRSVSEDGPTIRRWVSFGWVVESNTARPPIKPYTDRTPRIHFSATSTHSACGKKHPLRRLSLEPTEVTCLVCRAIIRPLRAL